LLRVLKALSACALAFASVGCSASIDQSAARKFQLTAKVNGHTLVASYFCPVEGAGDDLLGMNKPTPEHNAIVESIQDGIVVVGTHWRPDAFCSPGTYRLGGAADEFQVWTITQDEVFSRAISESVASIQVEEVSSSDPSDGSAELVGEFHLVYRSAAIFEVAFLPKSNTPPPGFVREFRRQLSARGKGDGVIVEADPARFCDYLGQGLMRTAERISSDVYRRADLIDWLRPCGGEGLASGDEVSAQFPNVVTIIGKVKPARLEGRQWVYDLSFRPGDGYVQLCQIDGKPCLPAAPGLAAKGPSNLTLKYEDHEKRVSIPADNANGTGAYMFRGPAGELLIFPVKQYQVFEVWSR